MFKFKNMQAKNAGILIQIEAASMEKVVPIFIRKSVL